MRPARHVFVFAIAVMLWMCSISFASKIPTMKIEQAYKEGKISYGQSLIYKVMSVRAPEKLPLEFRPEARTVSKSATDIMIEARTNLDQLSLSEQQTLKEYLSRPTLDKSYDSPGGSYKIHYTLEGQNAVAPDDIDPANGIPDYVDWVASYCDSAHSCIHDNLGYLLPPADGSEGGDSKYDIYIMHILYYGYTQPESPGPETWNDYTSYIVIHNNYIGFPPNEDPEGQQKGAAKVTCAHEYFHAVQMGYNLLSEYWYMEVSSTWMEEICYPEVNDNYNYFADFFTCPHESLYATFGNHEYSAFIFNRFLDQNFDTAIVRDIWEGFIESSDILAVINSGLVDYGSNLYEAISEFAKWNWCTSYKDDGNHYEDGADYPYVVNIASDNTFYPIPESHPVSEKMPDGLSSNYIVFQNFGDVIGDFLVRFDGQDGYHWDANLILAKPGNQYTFLEIPLNAAYSGSLMINEIENYDYIVLNPVVKSWYGNALDYTYSAELLPWPDYAVEVQDSGPHEIYSNVERTASFWIYNRGARQDIYHLTVEDEMGWGLNLHDTLFIIPIKDSIMASVDIHSGAGVASGTVNNIILTATAHHDSGVTGTDSLPIQIVVLNGDANNDGSINVSDAVSIINYVFTGGQEPQPELLQGDSNCDGSVNVSDAVLIINYVFVGGEPPPCLVY
jgi:hypothetical protein